MPPELCSASLRALFSDRSASSWSWGRCFPSGFAQAYWFLAAFMLCCWFNVVLLAGVVAKPRLASPSRPHSPRRCLQFLDSHLAPRAPGFCDYCSTRSRSASAGSGAGSSSNGDPNSRIGCTCACAVCGGSTLRRDCRCGRDVESMLPAGSGSSSTGGHGAAFGHGSTTAATYIGPTAGGSGSGSGSGRNYPGMPAPLAAAYEATARSRYAAAPGPAAASGARRDLQLLYRRDGAAAPTAAPAAALRIQVHAPTAAALVQRYASPMPTRVHISVRSNGSGGSASSTGRGVLTSPISGGSAAHARPLVPPPAPVLPRVVELVRGDRKHLVKLSVPTLVELLGML